MCSVEVFLTCLLENVESPLLAVTVPCSESSCRVVMFGLGDWHDSLVVLAASTKQSQAGKPKGTSRELRKSPIKKVSPILKKTDFSFRLTENDILLRCSLS